MSRHNDTVGLINVLLNSGTSVDGIVFHNNTGRTVVVTDISEIHSTGGAAGSLLDVRKVAAGTGAPTTGVSMLTSAFALDSTANTVVTKTTTTVANLVVGQNERITLDATNVATSLSGVLTISYRMD